MRGLKTQLAVALVVLAACDGSSPTAPPTPSAPPVSFVTANYILQFLRNPPEEVQVLVDGVLSYTGPVLTGLDHAGHVWGVLENPAAGRHTLSLRVTRQAVSPATYDVTGNVALIKRANDGLVLSAQQLALWDVSVTLATGEAWTGEFEIP